MGELSGKVAMITGGANGIGRATAMLMAARGAAVMIADLNVTAADGVVEEIKGLGGTAAAVACNIEFEDQIKAAVDATVDQFGRLDILHNNAAYLQADVLTKDVDIPGMECAFWDLVMAVNVRGPMLGCKHAIPIMLRQGGGSIINTSSTYGLSAFVTLPAYCISKSAIGMLTQFVATAHGKQGIRCNAIAPAVTLTPNTRHGLPEELIQINLDAALTPYLGEPRDQAAVVAFLASDEARFINGLTIPVDGGTLAHQPTVAAAREFFAKLQNLAPEAAV